MRPTFALAEPTGAPGASRHWLRSSLPVTSRGLADAAEEDSCRTWVNRLGAISDDLRHFLMVYSAGFVAALTFIA